MFKALKSTISQHPVSSYDTSSKKVFRVNALRKHIRHYCIRCTRGTDIAVAGHWKMISLGCCAGNRLWHITSAGLAGPSAWVAVYKARNMPTNTISYSVSKLFSDWLLVGPSTFGLKQHRETLFVLAINLALSRFENFFFFCSRGHKFYLCYFISNWIHLTQITPKINVFVLWFFYHVYFRELMAMEDRKRMIPGPICMNRTKQRLRYFTIFCASCCVDVSLTHSPPSLTQLESVHNLLFYLK
jgi:hypothetical protein